MLAERMPPRDNLRCHFCYFRWRGLDDRAWLSIDQPLRGRTKNPISKNQFARFFLEFGSWFLDFPQGRLLPWNLVLGIWFFHRFNGDHPKNLCNSDRKSRNPVPNYPPPGT